VTRRAYLALDLGTTDLKGGLIEADGTLLAGSRAGYPLDIDPATGRAEQDAETWWAAVVEVVGRLRAAMPDVEVAAIGIVGQGPTCVATDADARPTHRIVTWLDTRSGREAADLTSATGRSGWSLGIMPIALRIERQEPSVAARTRWYLTSWEWIAMRLSGVAASTAPLGHEPVDPNGIASTGLPIEKLAPKIATGQVVGGLRADVAAVLDLVPGTPVVAGSVDAYGSLFGAALLEPGEALDTGGTSGGFAVYSDRLVETPGAWVVRAPVADRWLYGGAMAATGKAVDWLREDVLGGAVDLGTLLDEATATPPAAEGLVFLPYLAGERSPLWDPTARGAFAGLSLAHGRGHLMRAVLEAAALALRHVAAPIVAAGIAVDELRVSGGPARSPLWNRIKADVMGVPVVVPAVPETAVMGAGVIASVGAGDQPDLPAAMRALVRFTDRLEPDPASRPTYDALYDAYVALHPAIAPVVRRLHASLAEAASGARSTGLGSAPAGRQASTTGDGPSPAEEPVTLTATPGWSRPNHPG
jgi:xylulokinase